MTRAAAMLALAAVVVMASASAIVLDDMIEAALLPART